MRKGKICGAVIASKDEELKDDNSEHDIIVGAAGEMKLDVEMRAKGQLLSNMEKVAGDLAVQSVKQGHIFKEIVMYGFLFDKEGTTSVCNSFWISLHVIHTCGGVLTLAVLMSVCQACVVYYVSEPIQRVLSVVSSL